MIALSADSARAMISMNATVQSSTVPLRLSAVLAKLTNIVFGSTRLGFDNAVAPSTATKPTGISV